MIVRSRRVAALLGTALFVAAACTSATTPAPSVAPSVAPSAAASEAPASAEASAAPSASHAAPIVAAVPPDELVVQTRLTVCSDIPYPPQEYFDDQGNPIGSDIEIGGELARRLGLTVAVQNEVFTTIILALKGNKCDIIISAQNITADRIKEVDMIPFYQAGQAFVVAKGNPKGIKVQDDLCGKAIAAETGTTEIDYINGTGDYKGQGLSAACVAKGKAKIDAKEYTKDNDALLALVAGAVDAYFADSPVAGYYTVQHPDQFELTGLTLGVALEGISVQNDAAHKPLEQAVQKALISMINDGAYLNILKKYGDDAGAITADVAGQINKIQ
jgi:polar amino acid transport system substrate-binding protein